MTVQPNQYFFPVVSICNHFILWILSNAIVLLGFLCLSDFPYGVCEFFFLRVSYADFGILQLHISSQLCIGIAFSIICGTPKIGVYALVTYVFSLNHFTSMYLCPILNTETFWTRNMKIKMSKFST